VVAEGQELLQLLGESDTPADCWRPLAGTYGGGWRRAVSVRGIPGSPASAHLALLRFLQRRQGALLDGLEHAAATIWEELGRYWGARGFAPPSREWLLAQLWSTPGMRHAVCQARLRQDLVAPYLADGEAA
jgi:hypothetical protein